MTELLEWDWQSTLWGIVVGSIVMIAVMFFAMIITGTFQLLIVKIILGDVLFANSIFFFLKMIKRKYLIQILVEVVREC